MGRKVADGLGLAAPFVLIVGLGVGDTDVGSFLALAAVVFVTMPFLVRVKDVVDIG